MQRRPNINQHLIYDFHPTPLPTFINISVVVLKAYKDFDRLGFQHLRPATLMSLRYNRGSSDLPERIPVGRITPKPVGVVEFHRDLKG